LLLNRTSLSLLQDAEKSLQQETKKAHSQSMAQELHELSTPGFEGYFKEALHRV